MTFDELISRNNLVLVDFFAEWCGPCQTMKPILQDTKQQLGDTVKIVKVDVDKYREVASAYQVRNIPTLILFKKGEPVWRYSGVRIASDLVNIINEHQ